ncbi:hypothetical protein NDU88_006402 [Pleurodeles waltl]|uniref:Uncharacterized protein n=1 Tax=Pleurodeles waltl TaxID=8319 RepID=A0AAV7ULD8_PLEWA|nr:hypothetical protein NDU88_006402 [Pleurodeles waltl]
MPHNKSTKEPPVTTFWGKTPPSEMDKTAEPTRDLHGDLLARNRFQIIHKRHKKEVSEINEPVDDLEGTLDTRSEDHEMLWKRVTTLEVLHLELQARQEDLENCRRQNIIHIRGVSKRQEGDDIIVFTVRLLHATRGDADSLPPHAG